MYYWLDVVWNLSLGTYTKLIWKATTILGITPSSFHTGWLSGDMLTCHYQYVYYDNITQAQNPRDNQWYTVVRTSKLVITTYVDFYSLDINNNAIRKTDSSNSTFYTEHYFNSTWIYNMAAANVYYCGMCITYDNIP